MNITYNYAILDLSAACILAPSSDYQVVTRFFIKNYGCFYDYGTIYCKCPGDALIGSYPSINFDLGSSVHFPINSDSYLIKNETGNICKLLIFQSTGNFWYFGDIFLKVYYTIFDIDNQRVGFSQAVVQQKNYRAEAEVSLGWGIIALIASLSAVVCILIGIISFKLYKRKIARSQMVYKFGPSLKNDQSITISETQSNNVNEFSVDSVLNEPLVDLKSSLNSSAYSITFQELEKSE